MSPACPSVALDALDLTRQFAEVRFDGTSVAVSALTGRPG